MDGKRYQPPELVVFHSPDPNSNRRPRDHRYNQQLLPYERSTYIPISTWYI